MTKLLNLLRPLMQNEQERRAYLFRAFGTGNELINNLDFNGATNVFIPNLIHKLDNYGEFRYGNPALCVLLEAIHEDVGIDQKLEINKVCLDIKLRKTLAEFKEKNILMNSSYFILFVFKKTGKMK